MNTPVILKIGIAGALGRMGRAVAKSVQGRNDMAVAALFDRSETAGTSVDGQLLTTRYDALGACNVIIDFTAPAASVALAEQAVDVAMTTGSPVALIIGSTGFTPEQDARIAEAAGKIAIVKSGNYSLGVNVLLGLVQKGAAALGPVDYDIEVFEAHHRRKVDAPSGTALMLGEAAARGRGVDLAGAAVRSRDGVTGPREIGTIGFSVMRGGGIVGEHIVTFAAEDEILTLSHSARDRGLFARGAVAAAAWAAARPPGLYDMQHVLGFRT